MLERLRHDAGFLEPVRPTSMNDLQRYFENNTHNLIHKWTHYFDIYDRYFSRWRGTDVHVLEIGVSHGGSLQMWRNYFGPAARLFGVDINPYCKNFEDEHTRIFIGDQGDRTFLDGLVRELPRLDIVIDDGGHVMKPQIVTFETLYPHLAPTGLYVCEDLHTSYWSYFGGGYRKRGTFIEYSKDFIDYIHAWHSKTLRKLSVSEFTRSTYALHYYDSMLVIEKQPITRPEHRMTGNPTLPSEPLPRQINSFEKVIKRIRRGILARIQNWR